MTLNHYYDQVEMMTVKMIKYEVIIMLLKSLNSLKKKKLK